MRRWIIVIVGLAVLGGLIVWRLQQKHEEVAAQTKQRELRTKTPPMVSVAPAVTRDIVHMFEGVGSVEAPFTIKIAPKVTGRIDYLQVREGDRVTQGQVLVRIDPTQVEADVRQRQADADTARSRLAQAVISQNPTNVSVTTQISQQVAAVASAQADYNQTVQNLVSQKAAAQANITDVQGRIDSANAGIANARAAIKSAQANLENAQSKYARVNSLYKDGFIAAQDVDDARTAASVEQGLLDVAQGQLTAAIAQRDSAVAQRQSAQRQADIVATKGKSDIAAALARLHQAQAALTYARSNTAQKPAYEQNILALRSAVASAEASLRSVQAQRSDTVLTSPLTGLVTGRFMDPGSMATPGQPCLAVSEFQQAWVNVPIPEEVSQKVVVGSQADVRFDGIPGRVFTGRVFQVNPSADPQSRQFAARIQIANASGTIRPGMFAHVTIVTDRARGAVVVPREAIQQGKGGTEVITVDAESVAHRKPVATGPSDAIGVAILQGVRPGDKVVVLAANPIKDNQPVRVAGAGGTGAGHTDGKTRSAAP